MFYVTNLNKMLVKSAWANIDEAEAAANRMRHESYVCEAEGFDSFKMEELKTIIGNHGFESTARNKEQAVSELTTILEEMDWTKAVTKQTTGRRSGACAQVHAIADNMPHAPRKDVIAACIEQGINKATASTQYQKWRKANQG